MGKEFWKELYKKWGYKGCYILDDSLEEHEKRAQKIGPDECRYTCMGLSFEMGEDGDPFYEDLDYDGKKKYQQVYKIYDRYSKVPPGAFPRH